MTIIEFLQARIAEDEAIAREVRPTEYLPTRDRSVLMGGEERGYGFVQAKTGRILAECEAKRRIVGVEDRYRARRDAPLHRRGFDGHEYIDAGGRHLTGDDAAAFIEQWYEPAPPSTTLRALAVIYSDHPDYLEAWRP